MKDIPIIFELVIVGFEVLAWILLLVLTLLGYQWIELNFVTQWATQLSFGFLGVAYMFGVIFDKAVSSLPFGWIVGHGAVAETADQPTPLQMRMEVLARNPEVYNQLQKPHQSTSAGAWNCF